jgi:ribosomal protein S12 methylthiotransferase
VEGATANLLADPVPEEVKEERLARFMEKQARISAAKLLEKIDSTIEVMVDELTDEGVIGRGWADAPEIDGKVYLSCDRPLKPGQKVKAVVIDANAHDLHAEVIHDAD